MRNYVTIIATSIFMIKEYFKKLFKRKKYKLLEEFRNNWGNEIKKKRNFILISRYFKAVCNNDNYDYVDDDTWIDLNMDKVFEKLDRCIKLVGSQVLYKMLRTYKREKESLSKWSNLCELFKTEEKYREKIQLILSKLSNSKNANVISLFLDELPKKTKYYLFVYLCSFAMCLFMLLAIFVNSGFFFAIILFGIINISIKLYYDKRLYIYILNLNYLYKMLVAAKKICGLNNEFNLEQVQKLKENKELINKIMGKMSYLFDLDDSPHIIIEIFIMYLKYFLLSDWISFFRSIDIISANQDRIEQIFISLGELDAAISIASYLKSLTYYSKPKLSAANRITVKNIYHPLLVKPVSNSFYLDNCSTLITGSNMAGKTTFIKTIALNIIFSQTLNICLASYAILPNLTVKTLIKREDNILEGASYYFKEVEKMRSIIRMSKEKGKYIFIIDEIFRGTNTIERLAISTATIKYIAKHNISLITTHDIELQDTLKEKIEMYHFCEQINNNNYYFDYKIKKGPSISTNAIRLLEINKYPNIITKEAYLMVKEMIDSQNSCEN